MKEYTVEVYEDGSKVWRLDGKLHREDGPAIEYADGRKSWWLHSQKLTEEKHRLWTSGITMDDALAAGDGVIMTARRLRIEELEEQRDDALARLIRIMGTFDLATGHADTMDQALDALEGELRDVLGHLRARREQQREEE